MKSHPAVRLGAIALVLMPLAAGCVTVAEFRKLERDVIDLKRGGGVAGASGARVAEMSAQVESLEQQLARIEGRLEVTEHNVEAAMREARAARADAASAASRAPGPGAATGAGTRSGGTPQESDADAETPAGGVSDEVRAYRGAYAAWRSGDPETCIDQFRKFLQTYPDSAYADDAAYWMADCYFKDGDYKTAVLRFDDVAARYPTGNKAADALYRQGEALLRLGPGFGKAAGKAFERVLKEYPDSARAPEAKRQLDLLGSG
ncbi:MAG: tol-pal system protein YbgF [Myxococcales bacterium]|nr:tol-pal system protein YbgF [Myxococcales bacterium]